MRYAMRQIKPDEITTIKLKPKACAAGAIHKLHLLHMFLSAKRYNYRLRIGICTSRRFNGAGV